MQVQCVQQLYIIAYYIARSLGDGHLRRRGEPAPGAANDNTVLIICVLYV